MRDILVTAMVFGALPFILRYPWYGVLVWSWLSYMNPHRLAWGFAYDMPFNFIVAIVLLVSLLFSTEKKTLPANFLVVMWVIFLVWLSICTALAVYPDLAFQQLTKVLKIQLITFVTLMLMRDFQRINQLIWVIVFSIGFFSVKGGIFTISTGGAYHVFGPSGSEIMENNALAVAILMIIPLMVYLYRFPPHPWVKRIMPFCIFFSLASVVGSQSRGAVLAVLAVGLFYWWKSKRKLLTAFVFGIGVLLTLSFMPESWHERVQSISTYQEDSSSMERIRAWQYSIAIANDRLTGGGFASWSGETYYRYGFIVERAFVAHSIYFAVLNDGGWPGLIMFLLILAAMWYQLSYVIRVTNKMPERADYNFLAKMLKTSIIAFLAGGAFLSLAYFDLAWHFMAMTVALNILTHGLVKKERSRRGRQWSQVREFREKGRLPGKS